jgi:nitroimidazol reductase NimA-like FMN-containing flavoprotein (pyridoxamine 5'-phosphate oxidase superfamily)
MAVPLSNEIKALVDGPNFAHLATLMPDGSPQSVPISVGREGDTMPGFLGTSCLAYDTGAECHNGRS